MELNFNEVLGQDIHIKGMQDFNLNDLAQRAGWNSVDEAGRYAMEHNELMYRVINPYHGKSVEELLKGALMNPDELLLISLAYQDL